MQKDAGSLNRESALRAGDAIVETASGANAKKRAGTLNFLYGGLLSSSEIEAFAAQPVELRNAVQYARRRWQLNAAVFTLLCLGGIGLYFFGDRSVVWAPLLVCAGTLWIRRLMRRFVLQHLEHESGIEFPR